MRLFQVRRQHIRLVTLLISVMVGSVMGMVESPVWAGQPDTKVQEAGRNLMQNAEDMVAHGGMGDANAIIHHCGEAAKEAESIIKQLSSTHPGRDEGIAALTDVVRHCKRVSEIGVHADPGVLLNPAIKARAAARASVKALGLAK